MFVRVYVIPVLAAVGFSAAVLTVVQQNRPAIAAPPAAEPPAAPYAQPVAGAGIVEASTRNLAIGTHVPGIVVKVHVEPGARVREGDALFLIDDRAAAAELVAREAQHRVAVRQVERLRSLPRAEDLPVAQAGVAQREAELADARAQWTRIESVTDPRAVIQEDLTRRRYAVQAAEARLAEASASLDRLNAGAFGPDVEIAEAEARLALAQVEAARTALERHTVHAPVDGTILQLNVRAGEFAQAGPLATPLLLLGNTDVLHVRVDVDENDAWRVDPSAGSRAVAYVRGNRELKTDLQFVRVEPYVIPKRSLTGDTTERVDTRVLQIIYAFPAGRLPVYAGQQMDVFIEAAPAKPT